MIRILIMDDSQEKIESIKKALIDCCNIDGTYIDEAKSVSMGKQKVKENYYDIVLLDLVLPMFDGYEPDINGGLNFIQGISTASSSIKMPAQIIGLTEKENAYESEKEEFDDFLFSVIQYRKSDADWINKITWAVNFSIRSKEAILNSIYARNKYDIGVICALPEEFKQLLAAFGGGEKWCSVNVEEDIPFLFKSIVVTTINSNQIKVIAVSAGYPGVIHTSVLTTLMFTIFHVHTVFMTGFAAGFNFSNIRLGDILIASSVQDYASGKLKDEGGLTTILKEIHQIEAPTSIIQEMNCFINNEQAQANVMAKIRKNNLLVEDRDNYQIHVVDTCCGPFVVASDKVMNELKNDNRKLEGLDMEGYGLYLTSRILSHNELKRTLWIKGIGDFAGTSKNDRYHDVCSFGSASLLLQFIKETM